MNIVFCSAEVAPFAKVGGLGDVVGSLPKALTQCGEDVIVCVPQYGCIPKEEFHLIDTEFAFAVEHQGKSYPIRILEHPLPGSTVKVYFFANQDLYGSLAEIYPQLIPEREALRYEVLGKAILAFLKQLNWHPDILHIQDWHTANITVFLKTVYSEDPFYQNTGTVLTIHNMAYQGIIDGINWLKEGLIHSDALVAVSPTYAREIQTPISGAGLEDVVRQERHKLYGILNGIDMTLFNPETDPFIAQRYDVETAAQGKAACKVSLQMEVGLEVSPEIPLLGMVTRLVEQKGLDLLISAIPQIENLPFQLVILGTGQEIYESRLKQFNQTTRNIRSIVGFNLALGQHIYAGSDLFLMPSLFEPCGLGQMIALRYGAVPLVRKTGGLADTVFDIDEMPAEGNGFVFENPTPEALRATMERAMLQWSRHEVGWWAMVRRGMSHDFSWIHSAQAYQKVYQVVYQKALQRIS